MLFVGKIRLDQEAQAAYFTSEGNDREYRLMYGDATSEPDPLLAGYLVVAGRHGQRVAFDGEMNDVGGEAIRIETPVRPANDPPDIAEGKGMLASTN